MSNLKFKQYQKEINGIIYTAQFNGLSQSLDMVDQATISIDGVITQSSKKLTQYVLDHVIVEPKGLKIDDFEDIDTLNAVVEFGNDVMQGKFRDEPINDSTTQTESKE